MRELESERENKENEPARRSLQFGGGGDGARGAQAQLKPCDTNVGIGTSGKRLRSAGDDEEIEDLWGEAPSPSKLLTGKAVAFTSVGDP